MTIKIFIDLTQDEEFAELGVRSFTGTLNDRQYKFLRSEGYTGTLSDMLYEYEAGGGGSSPTFNIVGGENTVTINSLATVNAPVVVGGELQATVQG